MTASERPIWHKRWKTAGTWLTGCCAAWAVWLVAASAMAGPEIPGADQHQPIAIVGATIHPVRSSPIEDGTIVFDQGKIVAVGKRVRIPKGAKRIDGRGRFVYPGLFNAYSNLGLIEIKAVRATRDYSETGDINPNVRAESAVNPDSELIPVTRAGGVLLSLSAPAGRLIAGTSAVLQLDGWTGEDMTLKAPAGMHVKWPKMPSAVAWPKGTSSGSNERNKRLDLLERAFADARAYYRKARAASHSPDEQPALDLRWEAMIPVLDGSLPLVVEADEIRQIQAAVAFAARRQVKLIVLGGYDAPHCAALLRRHGVSVIVRGVHRLPLRRSDPYDAPYTLPARLRAAGIPYCIACGGAANVRNLPYHAATAVGFGLARDEAIRAITLYPAQILGVADRVGSLEVGKDATLIVTDGDILETPTNVTAAFVQGRQVDLSSRHKRLWHKYEEKYRRLRAAGAKRKDPAR